MQTQIRRYNVVVKGKVQDIGFRDYVIAFANIAGVEIASLQQREITGDFDLPVRFVKLSTDEMYDIDRKLGIGNEYLKEIKHL
jgi:hypothetical protein